MRVANAVTVDGGGRGGGSGGPWPTWSTVRLRRFDILPPVSESYLPHHIFIILNVRVNVSEI